jgi:hypothetical protein
MSSTNTNINKPNHTRINKQSFSNTPRAYTSESNQHQNNQKCNNSSSNSPEQKKKKTLFVSTNRYAALEIKEFFNKESIEKTPENTHSSNEREKRIPLPPPIIVKGVTDFVSVRSDLE